MEMQTYILTVKHDKGTIKFRVIASSPKAAIIMVTRAENCPDGAIKKIQEYMPASIDLITPDGFSISFSETWKTKTAAKKYYNEWLKQYEKQGFYSSSQFGRIPLTELWNYMTWQKRPAFREEIDLHETA